MIRGKYLSIEDDLTDVNQIRSTVFNNSLPVNPLSMNVLVYEGDLPVGTGSIILSEGLFIIENIAILPTYRNKGYGEFTLRLLADKALLSGAKEIFIKCETALQPFFAKYGFHALKDSNFSMKLILSELISPCKNHCKN